jgi:hypothetical protein
LLLVSVYFVFVKFEARHIKRYTTLMKPKQIRFFTPQDNTVKAPKKETQPLKRQNWKALFHPRVSWCFLKKHFDRLGLPTDSLRFQIGTRPGKRKLKVLYLVLYVVK